MIAAQQASEAAAALALYALEGATFDLHPFGELEVVDILAEALHSAIEIETAHKQANQCGFGDVLQSMGQLSAASSKYLAEMAGSIELPSDPLGDDF